MSALSLVLANLVTIAFAEWQGWTLLTVLWIYWAQSAIIVLFTWCRILDLKQFSTEGFEGVLINGKPVESTRETQKQLAAVFLVVYGIAHLIYLGFFIRAEEPALGTRDSGFAVCILAFVVNHAFSYFHHRQEDMNRIPRVRTIMLLPGLRIIPMHLTIGSASMVASGGSVLEFLVLKSLADVIMHRVQHADKKTKIDE